MRSIRYTGDVNLFSVNEFWFLLFKVLKITSVLLMKMTQTGHCQCVHCLQAGLAKMVQMIIFNKFYNVMV